MPIAKPNILIIMADQLRRNAMGCYGDPNVHTPNIDRLANEGVRFANACSTYPICVPFRFTFMTGQTAQSRGVSAIGDRLSPAERTLADAFNEDGYHTAYLGKWHLDGGKGGYVPWGGGMTAVYKPIPKSRQGRWEKWFVTAGHAPGAKKTGHSDMFYFEDEAPAKQVMGYQTDVLFDKTMDYLKNDRPKDKPFCAVLSFSPPHHPYSAPEEYEARWRDRELTLPENFMVSPEYPVPLPTSWGDEAWPKDREVVLAKLRTYYAMIENADDNVGRMLDFLEKEGLADNTVILFTSDHGEMGGAHSLAIQAKSYPFEESAGIPLLIRDPRTKALKGEVLQPPTCTEDFFPTLCGLAGVPTGVGVPGTDLTPLVHGETTELDRPGVMLMATHDCRPGFTFHTPYYRAFRSERYMYATLGDARGCEPWVFFDLENDPCERNNLVDSEEHRELVAQHHRWLLDEMIRQEDNQSMKPALGCEGLYYIEQ
ncbi:MAG: sulfatase-like hydrolase/transferase [Candidatus Sumerlaeia bacterium]